MEGVRQMQTLDGTLQLFWVTAPLTEDVDISRCVLHKHNSKGQQKSSGTEARTHPIHGNLILFRAGREKQYQIRV